MELVDTFRAFIFNTGSGKTLAYLLPILNRIMRYKSVHGESALNAPYGVIIAPSRELADQIYVCLNV